MNTYSVRHCRQTLADFTKDTHRFTFWYQGEQKTAECIGTVFLYFEEENLPQVVTAEVAAKIWELIDKNERRWSVPARAREIADAYCSEEFSK